MRVCGLVLFGLTLVGMGAAQDSNFSVGPQYLMNYGSPMFLRPIATPTMSLSETAPAAVVVPEASASSAGTSAAAQGQVDLTRVYWGDHDATEPAGETGGVIEISGSASAANLPGSIVEVGVQETVDAQALRLRGYGVTVSEASAFWKVHKPHAVRVFTNRDVEKLHGG
jgi:hypothetical protein